MSTRRQNDRLEAVRVFQQEQARAAEWARQQEEDRIAAAKEEGSTVRNPARREFVVRSVEISHLDSGFRRADDEVTQAVYRVSQLHTVSPAELVQETEMSSASRQKSKNNRQIPPDRQRNQTLP